MLRNVVVIGLVGFAALGSSAEELVVRKGVLTENVSCLTDPTQTYTLYLPSTWSPDREHPALLVFDPRQRGTFAAEIFRPGAEELGWVIISSNDTRSDGPEEPNIKALNALWPEAHQRYAIDPKRIYTAGFSGGGILTLLVGTSTGDMAGAINCGGRLPPGISLDGARFAHYGTAGRFDFNYLEMHEIDRLMGEEGAAHRLDIFEGRHQWMDSELARTAMRWLEIVAMKEQRREADPALIASVYASDLEQGAALEEAGRALEAYRHYEVTGRTFDGLRETAEIDEALERLGKSKGLDAARREQERADGLEKTHLEAMRRAIIAMQTAERPLSGKFRGDLQLQQLRRTVKKGGARGEAAQRVLESIFSYTSFYLPNDFFAKGDMPRAVMVLEVAAEIRPEAAHVHYNLGCAYARLGSKKKAIAAIERAVELGLPDPTILETDPDLESIRGEERFRAVVESLSH